MTTKQGFMYTPKEKKKFMLSVAEYLEGNEDFFKGVACIRAKFTLVCDRPMAAPDYIDSVLWKSLSVRLYKATRPDCDNYAKPIQDSISNHIIQKTKNKNKVVVAIKRGACIIDDDSNLVDVRFVKVFRRPDEEPHIEILLKEINPIYSYE